MATIGGGKYIFKRNPHFPNEYTFKTTLSSVGKLLGVSRLSLGFVATPTGKLNIFDDADKMLMLFFEMFIRHPVVTNSIQL